MADGSKNWIWKHTNDMVVIAMQRRPLLPREVQRLTDMEAEWVVLRKQLAEAYHTVVRRENLISGEQDYTARLDGVVRIQTTG